MSWATRFQHRSRNRSTICVTLFRPSSKHGTSGSPRESPPRLTRLRAKSRRLIRLVLHDRHAAFAVGWSTPQHRPPYEVSASGGLISPPKQRDPHDEGPERPLITRNTQRGESPGWRKWRAALRDAAGRCRLRGDDGPVHDLSLNGGRPPGTGRRLALCARSSCCVQHQDSDEGDGQAGKETEPLAAEPHEARMAMARAERHRPSGSSSGSGGPIPCTRRTASADRLNPWSVPAARPRRAHRGGARGSARLRR